MSQGMELDIDAPANRRGRGLAFAAATASLAVTFLASASPIPLYAVYRAENGITTAEISLTVVAYFAGTISALLFLGRLANHLGRRPTAVLTLALLAAGAIVFMDVRSIVPLLVGRLLMGLGAGLASSALTSYVVDTSPQQPPWVASVVASQAPMLGLTVGAIGSGALVQFAPWHRVLVYVLVCVVLAVCAVLILASPDTVQRQPGVWRSLVPRVSLPAPQRRLVPIAAAVFLSTWSTGAFFQAFVPSLIVDQLGTSSPLVFGLVFSAYMAPSVVGAPIGGRFSPAKAQRIGMVVFLVGMVMLVSSLVAGSLGFFIVASVIAGTGQGIAVSSTIRGMLHGVRLMDRAPIFAAIYVMSYAGAAIPSLIAGQLSLHFALVEVSVGYGVLALLATSVTLGFAREPLAATER